MKALQKFTKQYLEESKKLKPEEIIEFAENYRNLYFGTDKSKSRLISIKIPETLLKTFRLKCALEKTPYQTQIKKLMLEWMK